MSRFELNEQSDRFEQNLVFRASRSLQLALAVVVALATVVCVLLAVYGLTPTFKGLAPKEPGLATPDPVTAEHVLAAMEGPLEMGEGEDFPEEPLLEDESGPYAELISSIGEYFETGSHPWGSRYERKCVSGGAILDTRAQGDCLRYKTRRVARGINHQLSETAKSLPQPRAIAYLEGVLALMPLSYDDEHRVLGIKALSDVAKTQVENYAEAYQSLQALYGGNTQPPVLLEKEAQVLVYNAILEMTKLGASPARFLVWTPQTQRFVPLFSESEQLPGLVMLWNVLGDGSVEDITAHADSLHSLLDGVPEEKRVGALQVWSSLKDERLAEVLYDYELAMLEYRGVMSERQEKYEAKKNRKASVRTTGLYGMLMSIGAIAVLGLLLALLAVERNTRALHTLAHAYAKDGPPEEPPAAPLGDLDLTDMDSDVAYLDEEDLDLDEPV
ncbi:MAG: hypothetical protein VX519_04085 [Myxococcota bacterium]|nr:hypothetical protein [Myxococcota bacterium]